MRREGKGMREWNGRIQLVEEHSKVSDQTLTIEKVEKEKKGKREGGKVERSRRYQQQIRSESRPWY